MKITIRKSNIIFILVLGFILSSCQKEKTAYISNTELIQSYYKMKVAKTKFEARGEKLAKELDSLAKDFQNQLIMFEKNLPKMSSKEIEQEENRLVTLRNDIEKSQQQKSSKLERESEQAADELVKEVRKKVEKYGEDNNYTYIFGSNESANILYAKRGKDITLEVMDYINQGKVTDE